MGHAIIAELAERRLSSTAPSGSTAPTAAVQSLLGEGVSLASISNWADDYATTAAGKKTANWHSVNIDLKSKDGNWETQCLDDDCLPRALEREIGILADKSSGKTARLVALKFVVHLAGELSNPLACVRRKEDGGASPMVDFIGNGPDGLPMTGADGKPKHYEVSFATLWGHILVEAHASNFGEYVDELDVTMPASNKLTITDATLRGSIDEWVGDCHRDGVQAFVNLPSTAKPFVLTSEYQDFAQEIIYDGLTKGAARLAAILNYALAK